jgi:hypothetical protein
VWLPDPAEPTCSFQLRIRFYRVLGVFFHTSMEIWSMAYAFSRRAFLPFVICLVLAGCGGGDSPAAPPEPKTSPIDGTYRGEVDGAKLYLMLAEAGTSIGGLGNISNIYPIIELRVTSGSYVHPNVTMVLSSSGYQPLNFTGTRVSDNVIKGQINGSGYENASVTLTREP